jgi:hypothetical protein
MEKLRKCFKNSETDNKVDDAFAQARSLGEPFATTPHLWGVLLCLVISGQFFGWNVNCAFSFLPETLTH